MLGRFWLQEGWLEAHRRWTSSLVRHKVYQTAVSIQIQESEGEVHHLCCNHGQLWIGIDPRTDAPTASKSVWDAMIAAHPSAAQFRNKALPDYDSLEEIFSGKTATGVYAKSSVAVTPTPHVAVACNSEPDFAAEWLSGQKRERPEANNTDSSSEDEPAAVKKLPAVKPLPLKNRAKKLRENPQAEVIKLLSTIVSNQGTLVQHHTAASCLPQALNVFKEKYAANFTATERLKFQRYLKENCEIFILQDAEEQEASIQECLDN